MLARLSRHLRPCVRLVVAIAAALWLGVWDIEPLDAADRPASRDPAPVTEDLTRANALLESVAVQGNSDAWFTAQELRDAALRYAHERSERARSIAGPPERVQARRPDRGPPSRTSPIVDFLTRSDPEYVRSFREGQTVAADAIERAKNQGRDEIRVAWAESIGVEPASDDAEAE